MKEQKKKRLIAILLLASCFISGYMLLATSDSRSKRLHSLTQADSLIQAELSEFNINEQQVHISQTRVDSNFIRKIYRIGVPYQFSKTQFHAELNNTLHDYFIEAPARVTFPEQNVDIHLTYRGTVIRTISLQTDPDLTLKRNNVSILVTFDEVPDENLISQLASLGEPIPIVLKVENPMQANELAKKLGERYDRIFFWLQNDEGEDILKTNPKEALTKFRQLENVLPEAAVLQFYDGEQIHKKLVAKTNLAFVNAANALQLQEQMGKTSFFDHFYKLQSNPAQKMAVIKGTETTLTWLREKLPELKKAGIDLSSPPVTNF